MLAKKTSLISDIRLDQERVVDLVPTRAKSDPQKYFSKRIAILLVLVAVIFACSPYTISRLVTNAEDPAILLDNPEYQKDEEELQALSQQEEQITQELAVIEVELAKKEKAVLSADSMESLESESSAPAFDPAIAPTTVKLQVSLENGGVPDFSVRAYFVAVGGKKFEAEMDPDGQISAELNMGRYNIELETGDESYRVKGDAPAFVIPSNEERDLGIVYLTNK